jgi:DNA-binding transcriptional MerR regulator
MQSASLTIGAAARKAGCAVATIRYYEETGLMPEAERRAGGHRLYGDADIARLVFIRRCRELDMPIGRIAALLAISDDGARPCAEALDLTREHLAAVRTRLSELRKLERTLPRSPPNAKRSAATAPRPRAPCSRACAHNDRRTRGSSRKLPICMDPAPPTV